MGIWYFTSYGGFNKSIGARGGKRKKKKVPIIVREETITD